MDEDDAIEVVVGRVGKPHGLRGEVTVDVRTDEPERRFADGRALRAEPPRGSAESRLRTLTVDRTRWHQGVLLVALRGAGRPHRRRGRARASCCTRRSRPTEPPRTPRSSTTTSSSGSPATTIRACCWARSRRWSTAAPRTC